jgi:hypothetical protein
MVYLPIFVPVALLLLLFVWALRRPRDGKHGADDLAAIDDCGQRHIAFLPQIQQALAPEDLEYLARRRSVKLARQVRKERRGAALCYIAALHTEFQSLLRLARVVAALSPEVGAAHEFERLRLSVQFSCRYQLLRVMLRLRMVPVPQLSGLSNLVSAFAIRMEGAMKELGERAALAAELASSIERRGINLG